jgi:hypothetical protein
MSENGAFHRVFLPKLRALQSNWSLLFNKHVTKEILEGSEDQDYKALLLVEAVHYDILKRNHLAEHGLTPHQYWLKEQRTVVNLEMSLKETQEELKEMKKK